jgi:hypothetical protein
MKYSKENLEETINNSSTRREVMESLGLHYSGGHYTTVFGIADYYKIDYSHLTHTRKFKSSKRIPDEEVFCNPCIRGIGGTGLKLRAIKLGYLENKCYGKNCNQGLIWNGEPLNLHLDHINGIKLDNRIENLRILCPNCHSQTDTFGGRNAAKVKGKTYFTRCTRCNDPLGEKNTKGLCISCTRIQNKEELPSHYHTLYLMLRGKDWRKGYSFSNPETSPDHRSYTPSSDIIRIRHLLKTLRGAGLKIKELYGDIFQEGFENILLERLPGHYETLKAIRENTELPEYKEIL